MAVDKLPGLAGGMTGSMTGGVGTVTPNNPALSNGPAKPEQTSGPNFGDLLGTKITKPSTKATDLASKSEGLKFSQHAIERMASRGISFKTEDMLRLNDAIEKAAKKGSKESLVLMGDNAFIVSVKNKTVVTAMDREAMRENVFTNIDSTVIL